MAKDGVVSIAIDYKNELNQMIRDYESALTEMASNDKLSKGMKSQFDNTIAELKRFKADMEKSFSDLSIGKVDKNSFKSFKETVNRNFESVRAEIDRLDLAVSTINSQLEILSNGVDVSKISNQFKDFQEYVQNTNNAIDLMIKKLDGQGISLMSFDDSAVNQAKSQIKEINKLLKSTDEFSDVKGSKYELLDTDQAQAELDVLARDLKNALELIEKSESELLNFDKNSIGFEKTINQINILKLKAADLHDSIQQLMDIPDKTGEYTFGDSILISDDNVDKKVSEYGKIVKGTLDEIRESAIKTREELEKIVTPVSSKIASAKISDKLNPNSAELVTGVTIETTSDDLWKMLFPIINGLQNDLNKNPVVAPVKLVVAPNAVSSDKNGEVGTISKSYSKKYQRELAKTGEDAVIDLEGVYKKTFTSIMDEAVSYSKETISKIQNIFESSPIKLHFDFNEEEFKKISDALLSSDSGKKIDITGQIAESKKEVNELADKLAEVNELLNSADSKDFSFKGFDKFAEEISKSLGQLTELQLMLKTLQNIESTLARASSVSSVTDIETQWQNVSKLIENSIKLDGTFRKNANVDKLASEYNKYLNMGGTNELSSIGKVGKLENSKNIIDAILSKVKELNSQKVDTSSVDKADDELKSVSSTLDDVISRLDHMINLTRDIGNTFWKMFKDASVSDVDKQWSSIESKFKSIADESGKINLSKQKKDIQELVEMYQKYANAGGMKTPFDLTNNTETIKKMNKVYEQMNSKKNGTSVGSELKEFSKIEGSVNSLTSAINTKTESIKTEANTMELAARSEIKSIQKIIDALNPLIEKIENIPKLKIPKEDTTLPSKESNISSGTKDTFPSTEATTSVEKTIQAIKEENSVLEETAEIKEKISEVDKSAKYSFDEKGSQDYWNGRFKESLKDITATNEELVKMKKYYEDLEKEFDLSGAQKNATKKLSTYNDSSKYTSEFIERVSSKIREIEQLDITKPEDVARLKTIDGEVQKIVDDSKLLENKLVKQDSKIADIISQMKIFRSQNTNMSSSQKQNLDSIIDYAEELKNAGKVTAQEIEKIKISFSGLKADVASTGNMGKNFFSQIGNRLTDMNSKFVAQFLSWQDWIRYIQQGINTVRELDEAMTEVRKVSEATESQYASFQRTIASTAKEIASTNKELLNSSADFLRLGYNLEQAEDLAKNATLFVNVGDGVDTTAATEDMITAMKAFDIKAEESIKIVDDYNQIGNKFALSATDIGEAMKRSASALETGNNSFEQSIALITAMNEIVQNSENTGNTLKVFSLRLRGAKAELESMGEDTDGLCESTSKLREQIKALTGVDIMINDNTFKSTTDIVKELGKVWENLSDSSQAATLELVAGKTRANNVAALLKNYEQIDEVLKSLGDAEGSAERENEAIIESINGRIKILSATAEEFWQTFLDTDTIKNAVTLGTDLLNLLTKIIDKFGVLPTLAPAIAAALSFKNVGEWNYISKFHSNNIICLLFECADCTV